MALVSVIVAMDDESEDSSVHMIAAAGDENVNIVTVQPEPKRALGFNSGARASIADYLCFASSTLEFQGRSLSALVQYAAKHPRVGAVGPKLVTSDRQTILHTALGIGLDYVPAPLFRGFPSSHDAVSRSRIVRAVSADCMLVRREAFVEVGGFSPEVADSYFDLDFCLRLSEHAWETHYHDDAIGVLNAGIHDTFRTVSAEDIGDFRSRWQNRIFPDEFQYYWEDGLMRFEQHMLYPLEIEVSAPLSASNESEDREDTADMLRSQSRRMLDMVKENIRMREWCQKIVGGA